MSEEESKPLIETPVRESASSSSSEDNGREIHVPLRTYGATRSTRGSIVPLDERITYTWSDINVFTTETVSTKRSIFNCFRKAPGDAVPRKHILKDVSGVAYPGELLAVMGASGAGKTTLLNALTFRSCRSTVVTGLRSINGVPVNSAYLTSQSAYVQQDDLFIGNLTVKEHLVFQALVRMDRHVPYKQRIMRVEEVITELVLTKCKATKIGIPGRIPGISGGERKRLSFASEILTNPSLMFCDEPTSGLDSFMALNVVQVLKALAQKGKTVVCTIHQPSSEVYAMFDKILLLSEGRTAFLGSPDEAEVFFAGLDAPCPRNYNPADYFMQLLAVIPGREESCRQAINMVCDNFERSELGVKITCEAATGAVEMGLDLFQTTEAYRRPYKASWLMQFRAVLWRSWLAVIKEPLLHKVRVLQTFMIALVLGLLYFHQKLDQAGAMNITGILFMFLTAMTFQNLFAVVSVRVFCSELPVFMREHRNGMYRTDVYFLCKTLAELPLFVFLPVLFTSVCYYMVWLNPNILRFLTACVVVTLVANAATSFGYLISCASSSVSMALSIGPPLVVPGMLFGGFLLNLQSLPPYLQWLSYFSWFRYGNEALMINQWKGVGAINCTISNSTCPRDGNVMLEMYSFSADDLPFDILGLFLLVCGFRFLGWLILYIKTSL
ncbi:white [Rhyzopertha dominica]|nr:white [Rhyzopertha dominica]